jgi:hypothetical protein
VRQTAAWLAQAHPYRQAARLLGKMIGAPVDHRRLWGWVQGSGRAVRRHLEQLRSSLFDDGEPPVFEGPAPPIVSTSADGTFIRTRDGPVEVKIGLWWTGAHLASSTATHSRYLRDGKGPTPPPKEPIGSGRPSTPLPLTGPGSSEPRRSSLPKILIGPRGGGHG